MFHWDAILPLWELFSVASTFKKQTLKYFHKIELFSNMLILTCTNVRNGNRISAYYSWLLLKIVQPAFITLHLFRRIRLIISILYIACLILFLLCLVVVVATQEREDSNKSIKYMEFNICILSRLTFIKPFK